MTTTDSIYTIDPARLNQTINSTVSLANLTSAAGAYSSTIVPSSSGLTLDGENADIVLNGVSLVGTLQTIQQGLGDLNDRLAILKPNPELEAEWDQLKQLAQQYRELEQQLLEKQQAWEALKK